MPAQIQGIFFLIMLQIITNKECIKEIFVSLQVLLLTFRIQNGLLFQVYRINPLLVTKLYKYMY